jgi:hypothetical protein
MTLRVYVGGLRDVSKAPHILQASGWIRMHNDAVFNARRTDSAAFLVTISGASGKAAEPLSATFHVVAIRARQCESLQYCDTDLQRRLFIQQL